MNPSASENPANPAGLAVFAAESQTIGDAGIDNTERCTTNSTRNAPEQGNTKLRWGRLLACVALLAGLAAAPFLLIDNVELAERWAKFFPISCLAILLTTVLRADALRLWRRFADSPRVKTHWNWWRLALLALAAAASVETLCLIGYGKFPMLPTFVGVVVNAGILMLLVTFVFALTNRMAFSAALIGMIYVFGAVASVLKVQYMGAVVRPLDFQYIEAFGEFFSLYFGPSTITALILSACLAIVALTVLWRRGRYRASWALRVAMAIVAVVGLTGIATMESIPSVRKAFAWIAMPKNLSNGIKFTVRRGYLFEFLTDIPSSIPREPAGYNKANVLEVAARYFDPAGTSKMPASPANTETLTKSATSANTSTSAISATPANATSAAGREDDGVNLVIYLIESLIDPADLRLELTGDPLQNIHRAMRECSGGRMVVPGEYHGSVNTELEIVSGISTSFLPTNACSYVQLVKRNIPTLFGFLQQRGYATFTIHSGPPNLYDRDDVYCFLHIGQPIWATETVGQPEMPFDIAMRHPSDDALVNTIIRLDKLHHRYFIYASGNATHGPHDYEHYLRSKLDVKTPLSEAAHQELKTYLNALQASDRSIGRLLDYYRQSPRKTVVIVMGDHWPPLGNSREIYGLAGVAQESGDASIPRRRQVPLLIWSNFRGKERDTLCSSNFLATTALEKLGIRPEGFLALNDKVRSELAVVSPDAIETRDGRFLPADAVPEDIQRLLDDYRLIQYDVLQGRQWTGQH